jgi:hypothetical protein
MFRFPEGDLQSKDETSPKENLYDHALPVF